MDIKIDSLVFEIIQWEIHLRRYAVQNLVAEIESAFDLGLCDTWLFGIVKDIEMELNTTFASLRLYSAEELTQARLDNWKLPAKEKE